MMIAIKAWLILDALSSGSRSIWQIIAFVQGHRRLTDPAEILDQLMCLEAEGCLYWAVNGSLKSTDDHYLLVGRTPKGLLLWQRNAAGVGITVTTK